MSDTWIDGSKTGDFAFVDSDGFRRYRGHTCNLYGSLGDALEAGRKYSRGRAFYVWLTVDGLYDFSMTPSADKKLTELEGATLMYPIEEQE